MKTLLKISDTIAQGLRLGHHTALAVMTITYSVQVFLRFVVGTGLKWTEELTRYADIWAIMIGFVMIAKRRNHINVSVLEEILRGKNKARLIVVQQVISLVIFAVMFFISFRLIELAGGQLTTNMRIPKRWVYWIYPPAFGMFVFQTFIGILESIQGARATKEVKE